MASSFTLLYPLLLATFLGSGCATNDEPADTDQGQDTEDTEDTEDTALPPSAEPLEITAGITDHTLTQEINGAEDTLYFSAPRF
jgi:hypothetical protein